MRRVRFAWIDERPFNYLDGSRLVGCDVAVASIDALASGQGVERELLE